MPAESINGAAASRSTEITGRRLAVKRVKRNRFEGIAKRGVSGQLSQRSPIPCWRAGNSSEKVGPEVQHTLLRCPKEYA